MAEAKGKKVKRTLDEFTRAKRRAACSVCCLPDAIRAQLKPAREKKIPNDMILDWLKTEHGAIIPRQDFVSHGAAHHEAWEETDGQA